MSNIRTYSELILLDTFEERFNYLKLNASIGIQTFGRSRYLNQIFYSLPEWKEVCRKVIIRDNGCDLGVEGFDIIRVPGEKGNDWATVVHHMNPITIDQVLNRDPSILDPEFLITTKGLTHRLLHYGRTGNLPAHKVNVRTPGDTCLWK